MSSSSIFRRTGVVLAGGGVYATALYLTYQYTQLNQSQKALHREKPDNFSFVQNPQRTEQFQQIASCYDDYIGRDEFFMGINLLRRYLLYRYAQGTVLEVGAGTGRNIPYYPKSSVQRILLTDSSDQMLQQARHKVQASKPPATSKFAILQADSSELPLPSNAFDTVVDTFGLCSYNDPVQVLREMIRVCKPNGRLLLLEHGRSKSWTWVTQHLDRHAEQHARNWGCVWNRDIDEILDGIRDAVEVESKSTWHFGTTYCVICRVK